MQPLGFEDYSLENPSTSWNLRSINQDLEKVVPISSLFILFMIIGGNYLAPLFPCKLQRMLNSNMLTKHAIGFLTLLFFVELTDVSGPNMPLSHTILSSVLLYFWFILTTTMESKVFLILVVLFAIMYTTNVYIKQIDSKADPESIKLARQLKQIETFMYYASIALTIFGVIAYYGRKKSEFGSRFSFEKFFLGKPNCSGTVTSSTVFSNFRKAFD